MVICFQHIFLQGNLFVADLYALVEYLELALATVLGVVAGGAGYPGI